MSRLALGLIRLYQVTLSRVTPHACLYQPTCSHYAYEAVKTYGFVRGSWLATKRLVRCNPFSRGGYDPVP